MAQTFTSDYTGVGQSIRFTPNTVIFDFPGRQVTGEELFGRVLDSAKKLLSSGIEKISQIVLPVV